MRKKHWIRFFVVFVVLFCLDGCYGKKKAVVKLPQGALENDILTAIPVDQEKTMVTVHYESGIPYWMIEALLEEEFPDVDIVMNHGGSNNSSYNIQKNLAAETEMDLIFSVDLPAVKNASQYLLNLSYQSFIGNYYQSILDGCSDPDGEIFYLAGPSDVYGVVYDRDLFQENGWDVPNGYTEFISLVEEIDNAGLTVEVTVDEQTVTEPVQAIDLSLKFPDAFQIVFNTFGFHDVYRGTENRKWLRDYQTGKSSMIGHMEPAVEKLLELADAGVIGIDDFTRRPWERSQSMYNNHTTAMIIEKQSAVQSSIDFEKNEENRHELGMFPLWISDEPGGDYLYAIPSYYMAINKASAEESKAKEQLLLAIFEYLSRSETQARLIGESSQLSSVKGVEIRTDDFTKYVRQTIQEGRIIQTFGLADGDNENKVEWTMRDNARALLEGDITAEEWMKLVDTSRDSFLRHEDTAVVYGTAKQSFTILETAQLVGDMYRDVTGAEVALVYVGADNEGVTGRIFQGDITEDTFLCISPSRRAHTNPAGIAVASMTGQQIMNILNGGKGNNPEAYTVASGLLVEYAPWRTHGNRLLSCKLPDGKELNPAGTYQVAYYSGSLRNEDDSYLLIPDETVLEGTWEAHFIQWITEQGGVLSVPELTTTLNWSTE